MQPGRNVTSDDSVPQDQVRLANSVLAAWVIDGQAPVFDDRSPLPPHHNDCLGCGAENPHGHHLQVRRDGDCVTAQHVFDDRHMGAPGLAHGGAAATVLDDLYGFMLYLVAELAVTRSLHVDYHAPTRLGVPYALTARLDRREGRLLHLSADITDPNGLVAVSSTALFMTVTVEHFINAANGRLNRPGLLGG